MESEITLVRVRQAIEAGDYPQARGLLRQLAHQNPTADVYYYGAVVATSQGQALRLLQKAMQLDPLHSGANRLHFRLHQEGMAALQTVRLTASTVSTPVRSTEEALIITPESFRAKRQRRRRQRWVFNPLLFTSVLLLSLSASWLTMLMLGVGSSYTNRIAEFFGGTVGIESLNGVPVAEIDNPAASLAFPVAFAGSLERGGENATGEILRDGVLHEYSFYGDTGDELAVAVQFFSPFAENVVANVAIFDPNDQLAGGRCRQDFILDEQTGVVFICQVNVRGDWKIRVFGREGESSGVYVVSVARFDV